jgi:hypothetical protein
MPLLRKPLRVEEAVPYALRELTVVPALVDTELELRALRTLLGLTVTDGIAGTGTAKRAEGELEVEYSGGKPANPWCGSTTPAVCGRSPSSARKPLSASRLLKMSRWLLVLSALAVDGVGGSTFASDGGVACKLV